MHHQPPAPGPDLSHLFHIERVDKSFRGAVPRRAQPVRPFKHVTNFDTQWMKEKAYEHAGLSEYTQCWTGEMESRPIPFVSTDEKPLRTLEKFKKYIQYVLNFLLPQIEPHVQTFNKISSLGYPVNQNPGDGVDPLTGVKVWQSKFDVILEFFEPMMHRDFTTFKNSYHTIGVRKQNESPAKERTYQFIDNAGRVYERIIKAADRMIEVPQLGPMVGSRTRTITRPDVVNLFIQCWDSMLHKAIMTHPLHEANIYNKRSWPDDARFVTFDCRHYERYLGMLAIEYAHAIGGLYEQELLRLIYLSFIVPSDDWTAFFEVTPQYGPGVYPQFSSGLACVADLGKLANDCVQVAYFVEVKHYDVTSAVATVFSGVSESMQRWNYGDDNRVMGPEAETAPFIAFMGEHFDIELDDTPKFLGATYDTQVKRWVLPKSTYNLKLYQPERDYDWKDYPSLGLLERRQVFTEYGDPEIASSIIPFENELWTAIDRPFVSIVAEAVKEKQLANKRGVTLSSLQVTDKAYLMTEEQKMASGQFWHLKPDVTATIALMLVSESVRERLSFKDAPPALLPKPERHLKPYTQDPNINKQEQEYELYAIETT